MSNPISPYYAITPQGNLVYVSEYNDVCASAELVAMHDVLGRDAIGRIRIYHAGYTRVVLKWKLGRLTAVSKEVAQDFLTIKQGGSKHTWRRE